MRQKRAFAVLAAAMVLLAAFAAFGSFSGQKKNAESMFQVDQLLIKVLVKEGESYSGSIRIVNGENPGEFSADVFGAAGMASVSESPEGLVRRTETEFLAEPKSEAFRAQPKVSENKFFLNAGQSKSAVVEISSGRNEPGIYVGKISVKSGEKTVEVPVIIEIETKDVLFDTNINALLQNRVVKPGADNTIEVRLFNLKDREMNSVTLDYSLKDSEGNEIITESESVTVATQVSFFKTLHIPADMKEGQYVFGVLARYGKSSGTSSYFFDVAAPKNASGLPVLYRNIAAAGAAILAIIIFVLFLARPRNRQAMKEYEEEMRTHKREALAKEGEIEEMKRKLEGEYRRKLAEDLQRHGEKKADIAKKIGEANAAVSGQITRLETKTRKSLMRKISEFMKEAGGARKKAEEGRTAAQNRIEEERKELEKRKKEERRRAAELRRKKMEALKRKIRHESFKFLHEFGIVKTKKEKLEEEKRKRAEMEAEEKRRKERLKKLLGHRKELAKKEEYETRKRIEARLGAEKEAAKRRQADMIRESAVLLRKREADYAALRGGLKNKLESLRKERERIGREIKAGAGRLRRAQQKTDREETERERLLANELKEKMESLKKLEKKHIDDEKLAKERLSQERNKIMKLKSDSLLLRLGLKKRRKDNETEK